MQRHGLRGRGVKLGATERQFELVVRTGLEYRFTVAKRKKLRHFRSSRALKFKSVQMFTSVKFV